MRDLPEEHDAGERPGLGPELSSGCGPTDYRGERTRDCTCDHREWRDWLERRVDQQIDERDRAGGRGGGPVGGGRQDDKTRDQEGGPQSKRLPPEEGAGPEG